MGAADIVPGVSGGTIALITGIYENLITSLSRVDTSSVAMLFKGQWQNLWNYMNGSFLLVLGLGIMSSILLLSHLISYLIASFPYFVWALFCGLIIGSIVLFIRDIRLNVSNISLITIGIGLCLVIANSPIKTFEVSYLSLFLGASIAICAMLLPGISGSFILLLLGLYEPVLAIIKDFQLNYLIVFALGAISGLLCFSKLLKWLMQNYYHRIISVLCGLLIGSLSSLWPWKNNYDDTSLNAIALPWSINSLNWLDHMLMAILMISAYLLVVLLAKPERLTTSSDEKQ